jgi:hypothetical protein
MSEKLKPLLETNVLISSLLLNTRALFNISINAKQ